MSANRFDQLLPLQIIPKESIYVPFRIADSSEIYAKLYEALSKKPDDKLLEKLNFLNIKPETQNVTHKFGSTNSFNGVTTNFNFGDLESALIKNYQNTYSTMFQTMYNKAQTTGVSHSDVAVFNKINSDMQNSPDLFKIRTAQKNVSNLIGTINKNPHLVDEEIKYLLVTQAALRFGYITPETKFDPKDDKTIQDDLKEYSESVKKEIKSTESGLQNAHTLGKANNVYTIGKTVSFLLERARTKEGGSRYNQELQRIPQLGKIRDKFNSYIDSHIISKLSEVGVSYDPNNPELYANLGELKALIDTDIQGFEELQSFSPRKDFKEKIQLYKQEYVKVANDLEVMYNETNLLKLNDKRLSSLITNPLIKQDIEKLGLKTDVNGKDLFKIYNVLQDKFYDLLSNYETKLNLLKEETDANKKNQLANELVKIGIQMENIKNLSKNFNDLLTEVEGNFYTSVLDGISKNNFKGKTRDKDGNLVTYDISPLQKDLYRMVSYGNLEGNKRKRELFEEFNISSKLFTDVEQELSFSDKIVSGVLDTKGDGGGGGGGSSTKRDYYLASYQQLADKDQDSKVHSTPTFVIHASIPNFETSGTNENPLATIFNITPKSSNYNHYNTLKIRAGLENGVATMYFSLQEIKPDNTIGDDKIDKKYTIQYTDEGLRLCLNGDCVAGSRALSQIFKNVSPETKEAVAALENDAMLAFFVEKNIPRMYSVSEAQKFRNGSVSPHKAAARMLFDLTEKLGFPTDIELVYNDNNNKTFKLRKSIPTHSANVPKYDPKNADKKFFIADLPKDNTQEENTYSTNYEIKNEKFYEVSYDPNKFDRELKEIRIKIPGKDGESLLLGRILFDHSKDYIENKNIGEVITNEELLPENTTVELNQDGFIQFLKTMDKIKTTNKINNK